MAVYKLFAEKDTYISSLNNEKNYGLDEILTLTKTQEEETKILIKFDTDKINEIINLIGDKDYKVNLKLFNSEGYIQSLEYNIYCSPISGSWFMGEGRENNNINSGVSWDYKDKNNNLYWSLGGGDIYNINISQSFNYNNKKDLDFNVTPIIKEFISGSINNEGFLIYKNDISETYLSFYSSDTHTIYPPILEFKWDDSQYLNSPCNLYIEDLENSRITLGNNKVIFNEDEIYKFDIFGKEKYPKRKYIDYSVYLDSYLLPRDSYYSIVDVKTNEIIIDYSLETKISSNGNKNYFYLYMNGLQCERWYKIKVKSILDNSIVIYDDKFEFMVKSNYSNLENNYINSNNYLQKYCYSIENLIENC